MYPVSQTATYQMCNISSLMDTLTVALSASYLNERDSAAVAYHVRYKLLKCLNMCKVPSLRQSTSSPQCDHLKLSSLWHPMRPAMDELPSVWYPDEVPSLRQSESSNQHHLPLSGPPALRQSGPPHPDKLPSPCQSVPLTVCQLPSLRFSKPSPSLRLSRPPPSLRLSRSPPSLRYSNKLPSLRRSLKQPPYLCQLPPSRRSSQSQRPHCSGSSDNLPLMFHNEFVIFINNLLLKSQSLKFSALLSWIDEALSDPYFSSLSAKLSKLTLN